MNEPEPQAHAKQSCRGETWVQRNELPLGIPFENARKEKKEYEHPEGTSRKKGQTVKLKQISSTRWKSLMIFSIQTHSLHTAFHCLIHLSLNS